VVVGDVVVVVVVVVVGSTAISVFFQNWHVFGAFLSGTLALQSVPRALY